MTSLNLNRGVQELERDELQLIPVPEASSTYTPVSHFKLANSLALIGQDMLTGYELKEEKFEVARAGKQLFATLHFARNGDDMRLSVGFRNSYDKSLSLGIVIGSKVIVCSNLMFTGEITVLKRHSKNILKSLEDTAITVLYRAQYTFDKLIWDSAEMKEKRMSDLEAFKTLGILFGREILSPRQLPVARDEWLNPKHDQFQDRNMYSFYNACTEALKSSPPGNVMERHIALHKTILQDRTFYS